MNHKHAVVIMFLKKKIMNTKKKKWPQRMPWSYRGYHGAKLGRIKEEDRGKLGRAGEEMSPPAHRSRELQELFNYGLKS